MTYRTRHRIRRVRAVLRATLLYTALFGTVVAFYWWRR